MYVFIVSFFLLYSVDSYNKYYGRGQWRRYARSCQVLCPAIEKMGPGAGTWLWYL